MTTPVRIRLSRRAGFDLQQHSRSINGLPAKVVARPTRYGNPYRIERAPYGDGWDIWDWPLQRMIGSRLATKAYAAAHAVELFRVLLLTDGVRRRATRDLRNFNAACWCELCAKHVAGKPLGVECADCAPCHADALLELANEGN